MLHLLPLRILAIAFAITVALVILAAISGGYLPNTGSMLALQQVARLAPILVTVYAVFLFAAWRWISPLQAMIFPYLGGKWTGELRYIDAAGPQSKPATMEAMHTLFGTKFLLETDESESTTLVVHAEKDPHFERYKLYYAFLNRRKEGVAGAGETYRGLAIVRCISSEQTALEGDYFTDTHRQGTIHLTRTTKTAFWKLWR
jgi:hypothetical protein